MKNPFSETAQWKLSMKALRKKKLILIGVGLSLVLGFIIYASLNIFYRENNFRTLQDPIPPGEIVDLRGLREIPASGGNAPLFADLRKRLLPVKADKIIADVKCESHGYVRGIPTNFFGYGISNPGFRHFFRRLFWTGTLFEQPHLIVPESEEAKKYGFKYQSFDIGKKFVAPDENIDAIVNFFDTLPNNAWVHVHCTNGKGRTSTILVMWDIMRNAPLVSLPQIIKRHYLVGSNDLFNTTVWKRGTYNKKQLEDRKKFIQEFYVFICQRKAGGAQQWSTWHRLQKTQETPS